ncbi:MAG: copper homeostasis protein CutC [Pirellulales bacterium]|nr:copper homeostasis protein CutC [Pirellulales bacterium]
MTGITDRIQVEVCVGSMADVAVAAAEGADRVELCGGLELGGLTPSVGLVETVLAESSIPVIVMLRPRAGGFCYDRAEFAAMLRDARRLLDVGAAGVAFGVLDRQGRIDAARSREVVALTAPLPAVFHRAFDFASDRPAALDVLIEIGCTRVLTSGGKPTAEAGAAELCDLIRRAAGRIEIMPGGGITAENVASIVRETGCRQVHIGASAPSDDGSLGSESGIELCDRRYIEGARYRAVAADAVAATISAIRR